MFSRTIPMLIVLSLALSGCKKDESPVQPAATSGSIKGRVSLPSGVAAVGANVYTLPPTSSTTTDDGGAYVLSSLTPGMYTVVAIKNDSTGSRQVAVKAGEATPCDIPMASCNRLPGSPVNVIPFDGSSVYSTAVVLEWSCTDPDGDVLLYDVYLDTSNPPGTLAASSLRDSILTKAGLDTGRTYYWRIIAKDTHGGGTSGDVWRFVTHNPAVDTSLVLFLPFNGNAKDMSGYGNDASVHGATLTSGRFGDPQSAYSFNGVDNHLEVAYSASLHLTSQYTLCGWVYPTGFYSGRCQGNEIVSKGSTMDEPGYYSMGYNDNLVGDDCSVFIPTDERFGVTTNFEGMIRSEIGDTTRIATGRWYFVVETYDGTAMKLYVNGTLKGSFAVSGTLQTNTRSIWIGASENPSYPYPVSGKIDDVRIYRRALSSAEIQGLYIQQ